MPKGTDLPEFSQFYYTLKMISIGNIDSIFPSPTLVKGVGRASLRATKT